MSNMFPIVLQKKQSTCGLTCVQMIARYYGIDINSNVMLDCYQTNEGISIFNLVRLASKIGLTAKAVRASKSQLLEVVELPCILHWFDRHYVVLYKLDLSTATIADPAIGIKQMEVSLLFKGWIKGQSGDTGVVVMLSPKKRT